MFHIRSTHEAYWSSYRLLEKQLLRLSHSICFDDEQIDVYSSELADIINSACIKIESLAKDIYEEHICPFQLDNGLVPISFTEGKPKKSASKFKPEKWTRDNWKFDYNCLVEIDKKFLLSKKRVELKSKRFNFMEYGSVILPFGNISVNECSGGYWEHSNRNLWRVDIHKLQAVDWCKSYQAIKHNYIQSIPEHGTVKNAIMVLSAFYLLAVYNSCLPSCQFDLNNELEHQLDFGSELFSCNVCNYTIPPCIVDSEYIKQESKYIESVLKDKNKDVLLEQELLNNIEGFLFFITLNREVYNEVNTLVEQYCNSIGLDRFDIAPYQNKCKIKPNDAGAELYRKLQKYIIPPYYKNNICITFNTGTDQVYDSLLLDHFGYEKSKYIKQTKSVLDILQIGDVVNAKFVHEEYMSEAEVVKLSENIIELSVVVDGVKCVASYPKVNIVYIKKLSSQCNHILAV